MLIRTLTLLSLFLIFGCSKETPPASTPAPQNGLGATGSVRSVQFAKSGLSARLDFVSLPTKLRSDSPFVLRFWKTNEGTEAAGPFVDPGFPLNSDTVHLEMREEGMAHGSKPTKITRQETAGEIRFYVSNVIFSMGGNWFIDIDFVESGVRTEGASFTHFQN
jgi:hypothetical protein